MNQKNINHLRLKQLGLEFFYIRNCQIFYPEHNHTSNFTIGLILDGELIIKKQN